MQVQQKIKGNIWKAHIFKFFISLHFLGGVLIPFFTNWGGLNFFQIMILQAWFMFWILILEVPSGAIADFIGRKQTLMISCLINILAIFVYSSVPDFYIFLLGELLWAFAESLISGSSEAFLYDTLKNMNEVKKSKKVFGRFESFSLIGLIIGAPIGSLIGFFFGYRAPMLLMGVPLTISFFISFSFKEPEMNLDEEENSYLEIIKDGVKYLHNNNTLKILAIDMIVIETISYLMIWIYQPLLTMLGFNEIYFGIVYALMASTQILIMTNYQRLERLFHSKKRFLFITAFLTGIMFILGSITIIVPLVIIAIILICGFGLSRRPLFTNYLNKYIPSSQRATILSNINMFQTASLIFGFIFVGFLIEFSIHLTLISLGTTVIIFSFLSRVKEKHLIE